MQKILLTGVAAFAFQLVSFAQDDLSANRFHQYNDQKWREAITVERKAIGPNGEEQKPMLSPEGMVKKLPPDNMPCLSSKGNDNMPVITGLSLRDYKPVPIPNAIVSLPKPARK